MLLFLEQEAEELDQELLEQVALLELPGLTGLTVLLELMVHPAHLGLTGLLELVELPGLTGLTVLLELVELPE
jgi:hypothetical protein